MYKKVKYTLDLIHGDGDFYNKSVIVLNDKNKIEFIDYLNNIEKREQIDFSELEEEKQHKLFELFKNTDWYIYKIEDKFELIDKISDTLVDLDYFVYDETDNGNFAMIKSIKRNEIN